MSYQSSPQLPRLLLCHQVKYTLFLTQWKQEGFDLIFKLLMLVFQQCQEHSYCYSLSLPCTFQPTEPKHQTQQVALM